MLDLPACVHQISAHYQVPVNLIAAVRLQEGGCPGLVSENSNGSVDMGPMQINSWWFGEHQYSLQRYGISAESVLNNFCQNLSVSAWILRQNFTSFGNWADSISAYNLGKPDRNSAYLSSVLEHIDHVNHYTQQANRKGEIQCSTSN